MNYYMYHKNPEHTFWNIYLSLSWKQIDKKYFGGQKFFGTYAARVDSKLVWVWNWAWKNMPVSFISNELYSHT